ncbi:SGNH/GDSL hydrolase family protein [Holdemanella biformis]|uniref:SGNH/GDSL hydrolase family protein n=1 Tax=Holdemanella biformis TaxID=1735 RepID=UPI0026671AC5|nr:SGNH/GDSL hydrolase family protein [Holdemanella biformis]
MDGLKARLSFDAVAYDYDDEYLTIDTDTHIININNLSRLFGVQYDGNSKLIKFRISNKLSDIQKVQDSIVYINWIDSKGVKGQSIAINKTISNDICEFAWKVPFDALKNSGVLHFAMSAVMTKNSSSVIDQKWSTQIASVITPDGIYIKSYTPSSEEEDRIAQIYNELSKMINTQSENFQSQVSSLKEDLGDLDEKVNGPFIDIAVEKEEGFFQPNGLDTSASGFIRTKGYVDISSYKRIKITTDKAYSNESYPPVIFTSKAEVNKVLFSDTSIALMKEYDTNGAKYVRAFTHDGTTISIYGKEKGLVDKTTDIEKKIQDLNDNSLPILEGNNDFFVDKTPHDGKSVNLNLEYIDDVNSISTSLNTILPNKKYTVIALRYNNGEQQQFKCVRLFDKYKTQIKSIWADYKFETTEDTAYYVMQFTKTAASVTPVGIDDISSVIVEDSENISYPLKEKRLDKIRPFTGYEGKKWMVIGDSITEHNFRALANYHDYVAEELGLEVINCGVSGSGYKVHDTDDNYDSKILPFYKRISNYSEYKPDLITVMGGINDLLFSGKQMGEITDTSTETWFGCVYQLIQNIKATFPNVPFGILSPLPACTIGNGNRLYNFNPSDKTNKEYIFVQKLEEFCDYYCIPFLNQYNRSGFRPWDDDFKLKYTSCRQEKSGDGLHPNVQGHELIYPRIREFVRTLI